jgi:hypothetical protein
MGNESWGANAMVWSSLDQFAVGGGYTKMDYQNGKLDKIHSYSVTGAYLTGNYMGLVSYTHIRPNPKLGTYGYNVGLINLFLKETDINSETNRRRNIYKQSLSASMVVFWTKPYIINSKLTLSPQVFLMNSPISWNSVNKETTVNRQFTFLVGSSVDYKLSKRFNLSFNYRASGVSNFSTPILNNFLIGSRFIL